MGAGCLILIAIITLFIVLGILIKYFKQYWLISGYNTSTPEEKKKIDIERVGRTVGNLLFVIAGIVMVTGWYSVQDPKVELTAKAIEVSGLFGTNQPINEIKAITLLDSIPKVLIKNSGSGLGTVLKGKFTLENFGMGSIYATVDAPPFVYIKTAKGFIIINYRDSNKTKDLYKALSATIDSR